MTSEKRYLEDFHLGQHFDLGSFSLTEAEIIDFATQFDPQIFHTDPVAARDSAFGGLVASGWHSCSKMMRLLVDNVLANSSSMGSSGFDSLLWLRPVRPNDKISTSMVVTGVRTSASKPDRGIVRFEWNAHNDSGEQVAEMKTHCIFGRRSTTQQQGEGNA